MNNTETAVSFVDSQTIQLRMVLGDVVQARETSRIPAGGEERDDQFYYVNDVAVGRITGRENDTFLTFDKFKASPIADLFAVMDQAGVLQAIADNPDQWVVTVNGQAVGIDVVSRKTHIEDTARTGPWKFDFATVENVFLKLDTPLNPGDDVRIRMRDADFTTQTATFDPARTVSEAIHVNLRGFDPDDVHKVAYLSSWNGWQVDGSLPEDGRSIAQAYAAGTDFRVVDSATGQTVYRGEIALQDRAADLTDLNENYFGTNVWSMDFSSLARTGTFHLVVDGVGRSNDFELGETHWDSIFNLGMSGFYHQRSGIALEEPYTNWERPRSFHPDDGLTVFETTLQISETNMGYDQSLPDAFVGFAGAMTGRTLTDVAGGWHDAGDWDRRTQHIEVVREMIELWELNPRYQELTSLSLPENGDAIPDVLNEALWTLDFFRRLQQEDGGVRGGVESEEHPQWGDGSWNESLRVFAYGADAWTSWEYAGAAAKMSRALAGYDPDLAATYRDSAIRAMRWAEANRPSDANSDQTLINSRNMAAVELYALTGSQGFHNIYKATSSYADGEFVQWFEHQHEAAFTYAQIDQARDANLLRAGNAALLSEARLWATEFDQAGYGATVNPYAPYGWGTSMAAMEEAATLFVRAHALTGDRYWLNEIQEDAQFMLGANPQNISFLTGLGGREPTTILNVDSEVLGVGPPPGITIYGQNSVLDDGYDWYYGVMDPAVWPDFYRLPAAESFQGFQNFVPVTEYTVMQGMADTMYVTGYLAGLGMADAKIGTARNEQLRGTNGADTLLGQAGNDTLVGGSGADRLGGGDGSDRISGSAGNDVLFGENGNDFGNGGDGDDTLVGGAGNDVLSGVAGADVIFGGDGNDKLAGGTGDDSLFGSVGADSILGDDGADYLKGGVNRDSLFGGIGNDTLSGCSQADVLSGGGGRDSFIFREGDGPDTILDFDARFDRLLLSDADGATGAAILAEYGTFNAARTVCTLQFSETDVLVIRSATPLTRAAIADAIDII